MSHNTCAYPHHVVTQPGVECARGVVIPDVDATSSECAVKGPKGSTCGGGSDTKAQGRDAQGARTFAVAVQDVECVHCVAGSINTVCCVEETSYGAHNYVDACTHTTCMPPTYTTTQDNGCQAFQRDW